MKKHRKIILTVGVAAVVIAVGIACWLGVSHSEKISAMEEPYVYPVRPGTEAWSAAESAEERQAMCQIPEEILTELTTKALAETVADYPLLAEMTAFSTPELGYTAVRDGFNGLQELEKRPDGVDELLAYYQSATEQENDLDVMTRAAVEITLLELGGQDAASLGVDFEALETFFPDYAS